MQYFGMEHKGRCVGNRVEAYTTDMDFHTSSKLVKLTYPLKTSTAGRPELNSERCWMIFAPTSAI